MQERFMMIMMKMVMMMMLMVVMMILMVVILMMVMEMMMMVVMVMMLKVMMTIKMCVGLIMQRWRRPHCGEGSTCTKSSKLNNDVFYDVFSTWLHTTLKC